MSGHSYSNYLEEKGIGSWFYSIDHKRIGVMYLFSILVFFFTAGIIALAFRTEHLVPQAAEAGKKLFMDAQTYNRAFTLHGAMMVFLFIVPGIPATIGNFALPIMIGAKDVAFPRINRLSLWVYWVGAFMAMLALSSPIDTGWTFYSPYSVESGTGVIMMTAAAFVLGMASVLTGLNFIVTVHKLRAPGMTWHRMPLFVWATYAASLIQILATPIVAITLVLLIMERVFGVGFFDPKNGGDPILFEQFFWFYSHPVVYIMILPALGIVADIIPVFARKPIFGYKAIAYSSVAICAFSFLIWGHHLFTSGMSDTVRYIFSFLTFFVAVPTAIKVFNFVATLHGASIRLETPMLYAIGFIWTFIIGGLTGLPLATLSTDIVLHDTYNVVAHFHYTMQGGTVLALFAAMYFYWPKMFGRMYFDKLSKISWAFVFIGFNVTFIPMFFIGYEGHPRRYFNYDPQWHTEHVIATIGAYMLGLGYFTAFLNLVVSIFKGKKATDNPWESLSLEWKTGTPPLPLNFKEVPTVTDWPYGYGGAKQSNH